MRPAGKKVLRRCLWSAGIILTAYFIAFVIFVRSHLFCGIMRATRTTAIFLAIDDTPRNRFFVSFYAPLLHLFGFPVEWEKH